MKQKKNKILTTLFVVFMLGLSISSLASQIFKSGFESIVQKVNDSGITWSANAISGNNATCLGDNISAPQDCDAGRDNINNDDTDGHAGFSFTKLDANGNALPNNAAEWICVKDNRTGLIWEVKVTGTGVHNKDNLYAWGGPTAIGYGHPDAQGNYGMSSWDDLINQSNDNVFCGYNDWRVPTLNELLSLVNYYKNNLTIDLNYFPQTVAKEYWTASPRAFDNLNAWYVGFEYGFSYKKIREQGFRVRIVRKDR